MNLERGLNKFIAAIFTCTVICSTAIYAEANAQGRAHQHGVGQLDIAFEGHHVEIELTLPGVDAVGFEHAAKTKKDRQAVRKAVKTLKDGARIISFPAAAQCRFEKVEVKSTMLEDHGIHHGHGKHKAHKKHDDHGKHRHDKNGHHKHGHHKNKHAAKQVHGEFSANYNVECKQVAKLAYLELTFFKAFPSAQKLVSRWIKAGKQGGATLTASRTRLTF